MAASSKPKRRGFANHQCAPLRREKENTTMKHEPVRLLLKALHGVYADEALTPRERGEVVADVLDDYADRTGGRDGLKDIASIPATIDEPDLTKADTRHALAMTILEGKAEALRKVNPSLTREQAFAGPTRTRPMPKSRRSSAPQTRRASRNRRPPHTQPTTWRSACSSPSVTTRSTPSKVKAAELRKARPSADPNRRLSPRSTRTRPIARWLPPSGSRRAGGFVRRLSNSMLSVAASDRSRRVLRFRRDCLAGGGMSSRRRPLFLLGF